jgi:hypothetical protein
MKMFKKTIIHILAGSVVLLVMFFVVYGENSDYMRSWRYVRRTVEWKPWKEPCYKVQWQRLNTSMNMHTVAFIIMTSSVTKELHLAQRRIWLRDVPHIWAFSDEYDDIFVHTLPSLYGRKTYKDAQHRQLRGMQWLYRHPGKLRGVEWIFLIDDDTWVNMPVFSRMLSLLDSNISLLCGYQAENGMFNGGAGILLSRQAYNIIAPRLYSEICPFMGANDDTVTECARKSDIHMIHSGMFSFYPTYIDSAVDFIEQITVHPVKDHALVEAMTWTSRRFYS